MENKSSLSSNESLGIIESMIAEARRSFSKTSIFFLLWGFLMALAGLGEFVLLQQNYAHPYIVWPIAGVIGGIWAGIIGKKQSMEKGTITVIDKAIMGIWVGYTITLILTIVACVSNKLNPGPFIILLTGLPTLATGVTINFKPLIFGGITFWVIGIVSFYVPTVFQPLLFTLSLILGYIIPGLMLKKAEDNGSL